MNRYRIEHGIVYEYDAHQNGYVCIGKTSQFHKNELFAMRNEECDEDHTISWENEDQDDDEYVA